MHTVAVIVPSFGTPESPPVMASKASQGHSTNASGHAPSATGTAKGRFVNSTHARVSQVTIMCSHHEARPMKTTRVFARCACCGNAAESARVRTGEHLRIHDTSSLLRCVNCVYNFLIVRVPFPLVRTANVAQLRPVACIARASS